MANATLAHVTWKRRQWYAGGLAKQPGTKRPIFEAGKRSKTGESLDVRSGRVLGKTAPRHTSEEFVGFLVQMVGGCKPKQQIHVILDNLSAHKTAKVQDFLKEHPNVRLHFTPTYSSWLNQVEIWLARSSGR